MRLLDAISAAGGLQPTSAGVVSISHRSDPAPAKTYRVNGPLAGNENPEIQAGDTIQAEKAGIVYVVGAVNRAGGFVMENGKSVTVLQALSLASGATSFAKLKNACLIRTVDGNKTMIPVDVKALLSDSTKDQQMTPDDILFIPNNNFREAMRNYTQAAVSGVVGLAIYHI
jgi:polysaccharide export outer membrane protein